MESPKEVSVPRDVGVQQSVMDTLVTGKVAASETSMPRDVWPLKLTRVIWVLSLRSAAGRSHSRQDGPVRIPRRIRSSDVMIG